MQERYPWWLWPNLLSLDAPAVAAAWYALLAHSRRIDVDVPAAVVLALTVWSIYAADRVLDARRGVVLTPRHRYARDHATVLLVLAGAAAVAACAGTTLLPRPTLVHGAALATAVAAYLLVVHRIPAGRSRIKELVMSALFAGGVLAPLPRAAELGFAWAATAVVVWINVDAIHAWESAERTPLAPGRAGVAAGVILLALAGGSDYYGALALSAFLMFALDGVRPRLTANMLRAAADLALLAPALLLRCR